MSSSGRLNESYIDTLANISGVSSVAGVLSITDTSSSESQGINSGSRGEFGPMSGLSLNGINRDKLSLVGIKDVNGSFFKEGTNEVILGKSAAESQNKTIGDNITIASTNFKITGIFETGSIMTDSGGAYTSLSKLQNITDSNYVNQILIKTTEGANDTTISENIEKKYGGDDLSTITAEEQAEMLNNAIGILDMASLAISALAILIGGIGIINTMIMVVYERTKEIGVLKAVGWTSNRVLGMILGETLVLTLVSGVVGTIFGILMSEIGIRLLGSGPGSDMFSLAYTANTFILAFGVAILVGIIGGIYPAYRASKLAPTEALRYE
ncbi:ABC transporter permease [Methanobrevibacter arboriphilus]|uniref:ABC transporter permease n=1 Tax=Methanobrevibacter arboriphilus TaxID=39441 RepID=UPI000AF13B13|nr:FtsX-like permease family protein [Methanobrevibacter arboriphilus]